MLNNKWIIKVYLDYSIVFSFKSINSDLEKKWSKLKYRPYFKKLMGFIIKEYLWTSKLEWSDFTNQWKMGLA